MDSAGLVRASSEKLMEKTQQEVVSRDNALSEIRHAILELKIQLQDSDQPDMDEPQEVILFSNGVEAIERILLMLMKDLTLKRMIVQTATGFAFAVASQKKPSVNADALTASIQAYQMKPYVKDDAISKVIKALAAV